MKLLGGIFLGLWLGIVLCATWLHTTYLPQQTKFELALMRCDAEKTKVAGEVVKIRRYLGGMR